MREFCEYTSNKEQFEKDIKMLIDYIEEVKKESKIKILYLIRNECEVRYGDCFDVNSFKKIKLGDEDGLKTIYNFLQAYFKDEFVEGYCYSQNNSSKLIPTIGSKIILRIDSNVPSDKSWFLEKSAELNPQNKARRK